MSREAPRILVVRFSSLGDVILTTPVYRNLKNLLPACHVTVAVKRRFAGVLEGNPCIDRILALEEGESLISFLRRIQENRFDWLIDLHGNLRSRVIALFSGIPHVARYRKAFWERRTFVRNKRRDPELERHTVDRYLDALKALGLQPQRLAPEIFPGRAGPAAPLRILVIQTAFLGDAVLTTPLFSAIHEGFPNAQISVLCTPEIKDVFSSISEIHEVLLMDKRKRSSGSPSLWSWSRRLKGNYDVALLPHRSFRSALLAWLSGVPKRIGFGNSEGRIFLTDRVSFDWQTHDAERNMKLLQALGLSPGKPRVRLPQDAAFDFSEFCAKHGIPQNAVLVGMNVGSVWNTKRWLPERFAEVSDRLTDECGATVLLFGGTPDRTAVDAVRAHLKRPAIDLCGKTDLTTLSQAISRCSLFLTNDSGPMHLAAAAKIPVVAIFGPTTRELGFFPYSENAIVVERELECRPCTLHGGKRCPLGHFKCMREIGADRVFLACKESLRNFAGRLKDRPTESSQ